MTALITLTTAGSDSGPFSLYSDATGYATAFATGIAKSSLIAGYTSSVVPDGTTIVRVQSTGVCTNYIDIVLTGGTTTTSTTPVPNAISATGCAFSVGAYSSYSNTPNPMIDDVICTGGSILVTGTGSYLVQAYATITTYNGTTLETTISINSTNFNATKSGSSGTQLSANTMSLTAGTYTYNIRVRASSTVPAAPGADGGGGSGGLNITYIP
jgi:hypothetical protein